MSTCEPSGGDPTHLFHYDQNDDPPEPDYLVSDGHVIPPDPLLESGTFIEVNPDPVGPTLTKPQSAQNGVSEHAQPDRCVDPEPVGEETERGASHVAGGSTSAAGVTPEGAESTPSGRKGQPPVVSGALPERPKWLPEGWRMEYKVRSSGASAGSFDRYYFEPVSGLRFRSKVEVDYFLQNGSKPNKKRNADGDANANANSPQKSGSKKKKSAPLNFDFNNVPEKVRWVLTDAVKDQWTPFIGDKIVPKSTRQEWNAAFQFSCS